MSSSAHLSSSVAHPGVLERGGAGGPTDHRRRSILVALVVALLVALAGPGLGGAQPTRSLGEPNAWSEATRAYLQDPTDTATRRRLLLLERTAGSDGIPNFVALLVADAHLRNGDLSGAAARFERLTQYGPADPAYSHASLGLGAIEATRGDLTAALQRLSELQDVSGWVGATATLMAGQVAVAGGQLDRAQAAFDQLSRRQDATADLRAAAEMASATARFTSGDWAGAAAAYDAFAERHPEGPLADDARFGAARARLAAGDHEGAAEALRTMLAGCPKRSRARRGTTKLSDLDALAILRAWVRNYQRSPSKAAATRSGGYSVGGCVAARLVLRRIEEEKQRNESAPPTVLARGEDAGIVAVGDGWANHGDGRLSLGTSAPSREEPRPSDGSGSGWILALAALLLTALSAAALGRQRASRSG